MRLLRKKTESAIIDALGHAEDTTQRAMQLVADRDREIERLNRELQSLQVLRDWPSLSLRVH